MIVFAVVIEEEEEDVEEDRESSADEVTREVFSANRPCDRLIDGKLIKSFLS